MGFREINFRSSLYWLWVSILLVFIFSSCGSGKGSSSDAFGTGSLSFKLIWQNPTDIARETATTDVCADYRIETITADVYNDSNAVVASHSWQCDIPGRQGTISNVPAGSGIYVVVQGIVSGNADWEGRSETFSLHAGEEKVIGPLTLEYKSGEPVILKITDLKLINTGSEKSVTLDQGWQLIQDINGTESQGYINANLWRGTDRSDYIWLAYKAELTDQPGLEEIHIFSNDDALNAELYGGQTHDDLYGVDAPGCLANATVNLNSNTCAAASNYKDRSSCCGNYFWHHRCNEENDLELYLHYVQQETGSSPITCIVLGDSVAVNATESLEEKTQHIHWGPADVDRNGTVDQDDAVYVLENVQWLRRASDDTLVNLNWNTQSYRVYDWDSCDLLFCSDGGWDEGWIHSYEAASDAQHIGYCVQ
jgi:hypothetical protein